MVKALSVMGYKTQVQPLSHFYDDYGLKADDDEEEGDDEDEDGDMDGEKEAYFMSEVARGEQLAQEGMFDAIPLTDEEEAIEGGEQGTVEGRS